jgi:hypothetical protein
MSGYSWNTLTSVCTMLVRCLRNLNTVPNMSTFLFSEICCSKISTAISVPVLPTPALKQKKYSELIH